MPTLPSTYPSRGADHVIVPACGIPDTDDAPSCPTPDPDLDEVDLVSVVTGDGVGAITSPASLASADLNHSRTPGLKPRLSLTNLTLHSPSSILGTPFDVSSPRFEYPFPSTNHTTVEPELTLPPSMLPTSSLMAFQVPCGGIPPLSIPPIRASETHGPSHSHSHSRGFSPTHSKFVPRDPPIPPTLAKKRKGGHTSNPASETTSSQDRRYSTNFVVSALPPRLEVASSGSTSTEAQQRFSSEEP